MKSDSVNSKEIVYFAFVAKLQKRRLIPLKLLLCSFSFSKKKKKVSN